MSKENELNKIKKELIKAKETINDLYGELKILEDKLNEAEQERDEYKATAQEVKNQKIIWDAQNEDKIFKAKEEERKKNEELNQIILNLKKELDNVNKVKESNSEELQILKDCKLKLQNDLRKLQLKLKEKNVDVEEVEDIDMYKDNRQILQNQLAKMKIKYNKLNSQMENVIAENQVLRQLGSVPDNYGFDLEEVKLAEKQKIEDYKSQVRYLEREVEELEGERTVLRSRLRMMATLQKGDANLLKDHNEMMNEMDPSYETTKKQLEKENAQLKAELDLYKEQLGGKIFQNQGDARSESQYYKNNEMNQEQISAIKQQSDDLKKYMQELVQKLPQQGQMQIQQPEPSKQMEQPKIQQSQQPMQQNLGQYAKHSMPPQVFPGPFGNEGDIREGYSFKFNQKIPIDMYELYGEGGFDQIQAKYEIASLQLMNLETIKTLQSKNLEYQSLYNELSELKDELKRCLLVQDELFKTHFFEKQSYEEQLSKLKEEKKDFEERLLEVTTKLQTYKEYAETIEQRSADSMEAKLAIMTKKCSILDVNLIKLARKYATMKEEHEELLKCYQEIDKSYAEKDSERIKAICELNSWKKQATVQLKILLNLQKNSMNLEEFTVMRGKLSQLQDQHSHCKEKEITLIARISQLEAAERELHDRDGRIKILEEEIVELHMEDEMIKKRLEEVDPYYRKYANVYTKLVDMLKNKGMSPLEAFQAFDVNKDGKIGKSEFGQALKQMGMECTEQDLDMLFMFIDLDGTESVEYQEFLRKLRRSGVAVRRKEEELIYTLYKAITSANLTLRQAFQAFDSNGDGLIGFKEMSETLSQMGIGVPKECVEFVFKMADISGDGQISYEEFSGLFDNLIKDTMRDQQLTVETELDWKQQIAIKIDEVVHQNQLTILDLYKFMDVDKDQRITINELRKLFAKLKEMSKEALKIPQEEISNLFLYIDRDRSQSIDYNELINFIRQAKKDEEKILRMKKIAKRAQSLRVDMDKDNAPNDKLTLEGRLTMKISMLELREKNATSNVTRLQRELQTMEKNVLEYKSNIQRLESDVLDANKKYYQEQQNYLEIYEQFKGSIPKDDAEKLRLRCDKMLTENAELKAAFTTYKTLYEAAVDQVKVLKLTQEKKKNEVEVMRECIKELQASNDDRMLVGKLYHQLMVARWQLGEMNKRYDTSLNENRQQQIKIYSLEANLEEEQQTSVELFTEISNSKQAYELEISQLQSKIVPTVTYQSIEEMHNKINEISQMKFTLEVENRKIREENYELALKCDYFDSITETVEMVQKRLKERYTDDLQQDYIDANMKLSELKLLEMKAKRDTILHKEKEEYYQRINRQHTESIKVMESEMAQLQIKYQEHEESWRKKFSEQRAIILKQGEQKDFENQQKSKEIGNNMKLLSEKRSKGAAKYETAETQQEESQSPTKNQKNVQFKEDTTKYLQLQQENLQLTEQINKLQEEINGLKDNNSQLLLQSQVAVGGVQKQAPTSRLSKETQDQLFKKAIEEESEKLALVAQKTITTLQGLIEDKDQQLARKDRLIEKMKRDFLEEKQKDAAEIRKLSSEAAKNNYQISDKIGASVVTTQGQIIESSQYWGDVGKLLHEKDVVHNELQIKFEQEIKMHQAEKKIIQELKSENQNLVSELILERKKNETKKLYDEVQGLQRLVKQKDKEIQGFKESLKELKDDYINSQIKKTDQNEDYKKKVLKVETDNTQLQAQLQNYLNTIQELRSTIKKLEEEIEKLRESDIEKKGKITMLNEQIEKLKPKGSEARKSSQSKQEGQQFSEPDAINKIRELEKQIAELKRSNADLIKNRSEKLYDIDGYVTNNKFQFTDVKELGVIIDLSLKIQNPTQNIITQMKKFDKEKSGFINKDAFYDVLNNNGTKLKQRDQDLLDHELKDRKGNMNITKFAFLLKGNVKEQEMITDPVIIVQDQTKSKSQQKHKEEDKEDLFIKKQDKSASGLTEAEMRKRIDVMNIQVDQLKKEKETYEKQFINWKEKCLKTEKELKAAQGKTGIDRPELERKGSENIAAIIDLKDVIFDLEEKNSKLAEEIKFKEFDIKKLKEDKVKLDEEIKNIRLDLSKYKDKYDNLVTQKISPEQLSTQQTQEKDIIIKNLKDKLEQQRKNDEQLTNELYSEKQKNQKLDHIRETHDLQVERLNRRIQELEEFKKYQEQVAQKKVARQPSPEQMPKTLKKPLIKK